MWVRRAGAGTPLTVPAGFAWAAGQADAGGQITRKKEFEYLVRAGSTAWEVQK